MQSEAAPSSRIPLSPPPLLIALGLRERDVRDKKADNEAKELTSLEHVRPQVTQKAKGKIGICEKKRETSSGVGGI